VFERLCRADDQREEREREVDDVPVCVQQAAEADEPPQERAGDEDDSRDPVGEAWFCRSGGHREPCHPGVV
jgi:hypothetical protein